MFVQYNLTMKSALTFLVTLLVSIVCFGYTTDNASANNQVCNNISQNCQFQQATRVTDTSESVTESSKTWKKSVSSYEKKTKRTVVVWYSTKKLSTKGLKCYSVGKGTKYKWFWNSYRSATTGAQVWFKDKRRSTLCGKSSKSLKRTACRNPSRLPTAPPPPKTKRVKHIREFKSITTVKRTFKETGSSSSIDTSKTTNTSWQCPVNWMKYTDSNGVVMCKYCPPPSQDCKPVAARCDNLNASVDSTNTLKVNANWQVSSTNATYTGASINWGDNTVNSVNGQDASHIYGSAGTYTITVTVFFTTPTGPASGNCSATITVIDKQPSTGPGTTTPGTPGGSGSGGSAGDPNVGGTCRNSSGDIVSGKADQFGYCV